MQKRYSPLKQFNLYWRRALSKKDPTADSLYLATVDTRKRPHVRTVLIKTLDKNGVGFVTQSLGPKVKQIKRGKYVEGCVNWSKLKLQVRVGGRVRPLPQSIVRKLWQQRPRDAQILYSLGIPQSSPIPSFEYLLKRISKSSLQWRKKKKIPLSKYYVGFIVVPETIEFLHHSPSRLNLREHFQKTSKGWTKIILAP